MNWHFVVFFQFLRADLKTMTERLKNRYYVTKKLFIADLQRIITNCREYNPPDSEYCKSANTLEKFFYFKLKDGGLIEKWSPRSYLHISKADVGQRSLTQTVISELIKGFVHDWTRRTDVTVWWCRMELIRVRPALPLSSLLSFPFPRTGSGSRLCTHTFHEVYQSYRSKL